jgi:small-conductance mechanosensitive channel
MTMRALFCLLLLLAAVLPARAQDADTWKLLLERDAQEIQYQIDYVDGVSRNLPGMARQTRQDLSALREKVNELLALARVAGTSPVELRAVLAGLTILEAQADAATQPFRKADQDLANFQRRLDELENEFAGQPADGTAPEAGKALNDFLGGLRALKGRLSRVKTVLGQGLAPTNDLRSGIDHAVQTVSERIPRAWKDYYLSPGKSPLSVGAWWEGARSLKALPASLVMFKGLLEDGEVQAREVLARFFGLLAVLILASALAVRRLAVWRPGLETGPPLRALAWMSAAAAVLYASWGPQFVLVRAETSAVAEILLSRGVLGLCWFLRGLQTGKAAPDRDPAGPAWWMFAAATLLQTPWLPEVFRGAPWVLILALAGLFARRYRRRCRDAAGSGTDLVTRLSWAGSWLYPLLCLPALFGWVNLTLLAAAGWFLLLVFLQAGLALYGLVGRAVAARASGPAPEHAPVLAAQVGVCLAGGLALPLTVIAMAGGFLFWLSLSMGGQSVFWSIVSSDVEESGFSLDLLRLSGMFIGVYLARAATRAAGMLIAELPARRPDLERGVLNLLETLSTYVIWGVYALVALHLAGAGLTSLAVVAGGLSVGIGFGMQHIINSFVSGLILLFGRSVQAGDVLQIGEIWGTVQRVNIRNTVVQTFDNATLFVPNSDLIAQKILNWSHRDRRVRRALCVGVAYGSETDRVQALLLEAASGHPNVLAEPKPGVQFTAFGDTSLQFKLIFWVDDLDNAVRASSEVLLAVERKFRENGIEIPHTH